jgi:hypothetical protein
MNEQIITTKIFKSNKDFIEKRKKLITEAISFKSGADLENQYMNVI